MQPPENSEHLYNFLTGSFSSSPSCDFPGMQSFISNSSNSSSSYYPLEMSGISETTAQQRTLLALKNHKEAEKRRRERINSHLDKLRSILPACSTKTDKASLLGNVVQTVRELKQQASEITDIDNFPSETDEISVIAGDYTSDGRLMFKASLCCEDRSDLIPDIIKILKSLNLKTLSAEIASLGGRIRNVLVVAADKEHNIESVHFLQSALKSLLERSNTGTERSKRRRMIDKRN